MELSWSQLTMWALRPTPATVTFALFAAVLVPLERWYRPFLRESVRRTIASPRFSLKPCPLSVGKINVHSAIRGVFLLGHFHFLLRVTIQKYPSFDGDPSNGKVFTFPK